jgi:hypothetical protein
MARLQADDPETRAEPAHPRGDEQLDEWFARRLEAQGIGPRRRRPLAVGRVLSVLGFAIGVAAVAFVIYAATNHGHRSAARTGTKPPAGSTNKTAKNRTRKPAWQRIRLTVLNGFGQQGAAGRVAAQLAKDGFNVVSHGNGGTSTTSTYVAYAPGYLVGARLIAQRLKLSSVVPLSQAPGVIPTSTMHIVVVLGPNLLPASG